MRAAQPAHSPRSLFRYCTGADGLKICQGLLPIDASYVMSSCPAGIISDVQYANIPDGVSFNKIPRYYRASLLGLRSAVSLWRQADVDFCIQLGDIVDGFNPPELAQDALEAVVKEFDSLGRPHYHLLGNHCLYHIPRQVHNEFAL